MNISNNSVFREFFELEFGSEVHAFLKSEEGEHVEAVVEKIELAWIEAPEQLKFKVVNQPKGTTIGYRGILWELFLSYELRVNSNILNYEYQDPSSSKSMDFEIETKNGHVFLMEAMSFGPREGDSFSSSLPSDKEIDLLRERLIKKHEKLTSSRNTPSILAYANSYQNFMQSIFERFTVLYGKPGMKLSLIDNSSEFTLTDLGVWQLATKFETGFSGILYGYGLAPGFSMTNSLELWLNPFVESGFDLSTFPLEVDFYAYRESTLKKTNRALDFEWTEAALLG